MAIAEQVPSGALWVGVDGSGHSVRAVRWGAAVAAERAWPLVLVAAVKLPAMFFAEPSPGRVLEDELSRLARADLAAAEELAWQVAAELGLSHDMSITTVVRTGAPAKVLRAASDGARMLVLGTRGRGEISGLLVGSVTRSVVAHALCPTVVIPEPPEGLVPVDPETAPVVVGVDGSVAGEAAIDMAFGEAAERAVELIAVNAWDDVTVSPALGMDPDAEHWRNLQEYEESVVAERLAGFRQMYPDVAVRVEALRENPVHALSRLSETAQLLVVGTRGRGGFTGLLLGSTSAALLAHTRCPMMVVRPDAALP